MYWFVRVFLANRLFRLDSKSGYIYTMKPLYTLAFLGLLSYQCMSQQTNSLWKNKIDSIVATTMDKYQIPGIAVGIAIQDSIFYTKGYGKASIQTGQPVTENTFFHSASISKLFTAQAIAQLISQKLLRYDDILIDLAPELNYANEDAKKITLRHLLEHTSGLPDISNYEWSDNERSPEALQKYVERLKVRPKTAPGSTYNYSNLGYDILGYIVEIMTGVNFDDFVKQEIMDHAQMGASDFRYYLLPDSLLAMPHTHKGKTNIIERKTYPYNRKHAPSSTLNASAEALSNWMLHFMNNTDFEDKDQLLGFQRYDVEEYSAVGHFGGDKGFRSLLMMIPEEKIGLVVLGNCDYNEDFRQEIILSIADLLLTLSKEN